ncbi:aminotransferase class IV [Candidatus Uhrbacteria bacterium]|nr:aminotransferase class IV [Candidatus Uhrbacteria bacterium]
MMHGRTVISPPTDRILEGVTRKTVRLLLEKHHFSYEERCMTLSDIVSCDGAFLTSTGAGIMPIRAIDEYALPPIQEAMKELMAYYDEWKETCGGVIN